MILHFPCLNRHDPQNQRRLSEFAQGVSFADMVDYRVDQYTRSVLAENADHNVDLTYPNEQWAESMIDDPECIRECNREMMKV